MASNYTPNDTFTAPTVAMDDGDASNEITHNRLPKQNADRTEYLRNRLLPAAGQNYHASFHTQYPDPSNNWTYQPADMIWKDLSNVQDVFHMSLPLPGSGRIVTLSGEGQGSAAIAPATRLTVELVRLSAAGATVVATATDNEAAGTYNTRHTFSATGLTEDIVGDNHYAIRVTGEDTNIDYQLFDVFVVVEPAP